MISHSSTANVNQQAKFMTTITPRRGEIYTIEQIYQNLKLRDSPCLSMYITNPLKEMVEVVVQDAHCGNEGVMKSFAGKSFRYRYETDEWIPVFEFIGTEDEFLECVETAVDLDPYQKEDEKVGMIVWPKGTTYEQYYKLSEDGTKLIHHYGSDPVPFKTSKCLEAFKRKNN